MILEDATDSSRLTAMILQLFEDREFRARIGENASRTAQKYTWERNGLDFATILEAVLQRKTSSGQPLARV
jgi:glycosyltransferase involved in cell wall biosynthesis